MSFLRPTLTQLRAAALADIGSAQINDSQTGQVVSPLLLRFDPLTILGKVMAGLAYEEYGYLDWIALQSTPATATGEALLSWGALVGLSLKSATAAQATARFGGTAGAPLPAGTLLSRNDGVTYATTAEAVLDLSGSATVPLVALDPGTAANLAAGTPLASSNSLPGILGGVVVGVPTPGADIETSDDFRARVLARFANPPNGGSAADYVNWALEVPGVTRAWTTTGMGPGTVTIFVMFDDAEATAAPLGFAGTGGFPQGDSGVSPLDNNGSPRDTLIASGDQRSVADALIPFQPVTALVYVAAPNPQLIDFAVDNLGSANTAGIKGAIGAALAALLKSVGDPRGQTLYPSSWTGAIAGVAGVTQFSVSAPAGPVTLPVGSLPVLGQLATNT